MKKKICALLVLTLALCWSLAAFAAVRMPENRGALTDDANVLGTLTAKDVMAYASRVEEETGVKLHVALVNFLDGMEVKTYARQLFQRWELGGDDLLLLGAAGEDSFAAVMGSNVEKKLGAAMPKICCTLRLLLPLCFKASSTTQRSPAFLRL